MERHRKAVSQIAAAVRSFFDRREPYRIAHGSTNSTRPARSSGTRVVDISALRNVLSVDAARRTALVEPNVPMDALVSATLRHGLVPPVVMEFPGITAGGGFAGTAGESSSFKHGFFDDTVRSVEMVLADGEVVEVGNPRFAEGAAAAQGQQPQPQRGDLFRGAAGAVGTLGVTTLLELELMQARRWVRTTYRRTRSVAEAVAAVREEAGRAENDYVDGILFGEDHGVVITGRLTDDKPDGVRPQTFSGAWDPWFYMHVRERTRDATPSPASTSSPSRDQHQNQHPTDYIPLAEYLFRYDRGGFWVGEGAFRYFRFVPFSRAARWFLDDFLHTRMLYRALHGSGESARFVVQDLALPFATAERLVDYTARELGIWPLWLCPLRRRAPPTFHPHTTTPAWAKQQQQQQQEGAAGEGEGEGEEDEMMLNIGVWGWGPADRAEFVAKNRALEAKVRELGGMKWLYAHTYYGEDEFWDVYGGRGWYDALREKYRAATLPSVYDKVKVDVADRREGRGLRGMWPVAGLYGIWKSIKSKDYMLHRKAEWKYKGEK
ncbi:Delta(24)-sterol reductase [Pleurostoma richardsiae]|uniref:Delta(24)-sterol reductase n=1 Tax=Pleurostoma richardsiae TaxID=41990 RepID=A0AA38S8G1_9PEZI|nr:Delta(24)-sterol reductase [Pleurostoma richardsiae]